MKTEPTQRSQTGPRLAPAPERDPRLDRFLALSDGVYAIALTLLAIELRLPETAAHLSGLDLLAGMLSIWPKILGFVTSFTVIAIFWATHHRLFQFIRGFDNRLLWLALAQLGTVTFLPFPTAVIGEHLGDPVAEEFYFGSILVAVLVSALILWYATWQRLLGPDVSPRLVRHYNRFGLAWILGFVVLMSAIPLGLGRLIEPLLLGYLLALVYIGFAAVDFFEPRPAALAEDSHPHVDEGS